MPHSCDDHSAVPRPDLPPLSQLCAAAIVNWHARLELAAAAERVPHERLREYLATVDRFLAADRRKPDVQHAIGQAQQSGILEYFAAKPLPECLWRQVTGQYVDLPAPQTLGEAARWILRGCHPRETTATTQGPLRRLRFRSHEELLNAACEFYADLRREEHLGIGGSHVLLSTSLQLWPHANRSLPDGSYEQQLARPEALGFRVLQPAERADGLTAALRCRRLVVKELLGGPTTGPHGDQHLA